jgi:hypothetical protein
MVNDPRDVPDVDGDAIDPPTDDNIDVGDDDEDTDEASPALDE